jgi:hypothetical protein
MKIFPKHTPKLLLAASISALVACGGSSDGASSNGEGGTGYFSLAVTDAPIDSATHVVVEFSGVSIKPADGQALHFDFDEPKSIDLLALQGSAYESLLTDEEVPAGQYEWIRLHVNAEHDGVLDSYIELETGNQLELFVPSGSQTGLKLVDGFAIEAEGSANFTIDFDLRKSIVLPPGLAGAILKPTLRLVDNSVSGSIAGTVDAELITAQCEDPANETGAVYVFSGVDATVSDVSGSENDPLITALVNHDGSEYRYEVGFLPEGDYTLSYTCDARLDDPEEEDELAFVGTANATVEAGAETELNFTLESAEPSEE